MAAEAPHNRCEPCQRDAALALHQGQVLTTHQLGTTDGLFTDENDEMVGTARGASEIKVNSRARFVCAHPRCPDVSEQGLTERSTNAVQQGHAVDTNEGGCPNRPRLWGSSTKRALLLP